ncbi:MAG TPA: PKD domain-containing protein [Thermoanaerobaculia bacterium]
MKRVRLLSCLLLLIPASMFATVEDVDGPHVSAFTLDATSIDVTGGAATVRATMSVTDDVTGVAYGSFCYSSPSGSSTICASVSTLASGSSLNGVFSGTLYVPQTVENGTWTISYVSAQDPVGNYRYYYPDTTVPAFPSGPRQLQVTAPVRDITPPQLTAYSISPAGVDVSSAAGAAQIDIQVPDADFASAWVYMVSPNSQIWAYGYISDTSLVSSNPNVYRGAVTIPRSAQVGGWKIAYIGVTDTSNNYLYYYNPSYCRCGTLLPPGDSTLAVTATPYDSGPPAILGFDFAPKAIDIANGPATITVAAHVTDDLVGVNYGWFAFYSTRANQWRTGNLYRSGGPTNDGILTGSVEFAQYSAAGVWQLAYVAVQDMLGQYRFYQPSDLQGLGFPIYLQVSSGLLVYNATGNWNQTSTLSAVLTSGGAPIAGRTIEFELDGVSVGSAVTDANGVATLPDVSIAGLDSGVHENIIEANFAGDATMIAATSSANLTVVGNPQTITFGPIPTRHVGDSFTLNATASSGLPVAYILVSGPATISGSTVTITDVGTVTIRAAQPGGGQWAAATPVDQSFDTTVAVRDAVAPIVIAPPDAAYQCASAVPPASASDATATDNVGVTSLTVASSNNGGAGTSASPLVITRTWTVSDAAGNSASATQTITVIDTTAPVPDASSLPDVVGQCSATVTTTPVASDSCAGPIRGTTTDPLTYTAQGTYTITWKFRDAAGNISTQTQRVIVRDTEAPAALAPAAVSVVSRSCTAPVPDFTASLAASDYCTPRQSLRITQIPSAGTDAPLGTTLVTITVADAAGNSIAAATSFSVTNTFPSADAGGPYTVNEGSTVQLKAKGADDGGPVTYAWDLDGDGVYETAVTPGAETVFPAAALDGPSTRTIALLVTDPCGQSTRATTTVTINNVPPDVAITTPASGALYKVGAATVNLTAAFSDVGTLDTHTCSINWDNPADATGNIASGAVHESAGAGTCTASYTFAHAGEYSATVTMTDDDGGATSARVLIVVVDPADSAITGGGWLISPAGALVDSPALTGKVNFGFVSHYLKSAAVPTGNTTFQFSGSNFKFESKGYEWLVVSGARAQYRGTGQVNGSGDYGFLLTAYDADFGAATGIDRFRIKIWDRANGTRIVYDNRMGAPDDIDAADPQLIGEGSIVIHK